MSDDTAQKFAEEVLLPLNIGKAIRNKLYPKIVKDAIIRVYINNDDANATMNQNAEPLPQLSNGDYQVRREHAVFAAHLHSQRGIKKIELDEDVDPTIASEIRRERGESGSSLSPPGRSSSQR